MRGDDAVTLPPKSDSASCVIEMPLPMLATLAFVATLLLAPARGAEPCAVSRSMVDLDLSLYAAENAFERRQRDALVTAERDVLAVLPCLRDAVTVPYAARVHRVEGFTAFVLRDESGARASFSAARAAEPGYLLPTSVVPAAHPMRAIYDSASMLPGAVEALPPVEGSLRIDGRITTVRPLDRPAIVQYFDPSGAVTLSLLLAPADALPALPAPPMAAALPPVEAASRPSWSESHPQEPVERKGPSGSALAGIGAGAGLAAILYGAALLVRSDYDTMDPADATEESLTGLYAANHGLVIASGVTAGLTLVAGVTVLTVKW